MGLHESIGWKTGEYIASSKAIVNEKMHYEVPGDFEEGKNYLAFSSADECIDNVLSLASNRQKIFEMQQYNYHYYNSYLKPDILIKNSLNTAELL